MRKESVNVPETSSMSAKATSICSIMLALLLGACAQQQRVVRSSDLLAGLPGAQGGIQGDSPQARFGHSWDQLLTQFGSPDQTQGSSVTMWEPADGLVLREVSPQGDIRLISKSPSHVMFHLTQTLRNEEYVLLLEQVLSERTRQLYESEGRDPREAVGFLKSHEQDIADLFGSLPLGEQTPGVLMEDLGRNVFRLRAPSALVGGMRFDRFDVVIENGSFRLLMIR